MYAFLISTRKLASLVMNQDPPSYLALAQPPGNVAQLSQGGGGGRAAGPLDRQQLVVLGDGERRRRITTSAHLPLSRRDHG